MKTPQRKFVVEFKSPRRLATARTNSIWGDTDPKALAREVADQSFDLNHSGKTSHLVGAGAITLPDPVDKTAVYVDAFEIGNLQADDLNTDELAVNAAHLPVGSAAAAAEPLKTPEATSKRAPKSRIGGRQASALDEAVPSVLPEVAAESVLDEIAVLDAENKRLKQLLVEHLRDQNLTLKRMLERFG